MQHFTKILQENYLANIFCKILARKVSFCARLARFGYFLQEDFYWEPSNFWHILILSYTAVTLMFTQFTKLYFTLFHYVRAVMGRLEQCEGSFLFKETQLPNGLTFPNYTARSTGTMWITFLAQGNNNNKQHHLGIEPDLLDHRPIPNHCMLVPHCSWSSSNLVLL